MIIVSIEWDWREHTFPAHQPFERPSDMPDIAVAQACRDGLLANCTHADFNDPEVWDIALEADAMLARGGGCKQCR